MLLMAIESKASVSQTQYRLVYDSSICAYSVYMIIVAGSTNPATVLNRKASTGQLSFVVPAGTVFGLQTPNEPKLGSYNAGTGILTRTTPMPWTTASYIGSSILAGSSLTGYDLQAFTPPTSNTWYPSLNVGDTVLLFSIKIATSSCGAGIRLFNNNTIQGSAVTGGDPSSAITGGGDFNNGLNVGSPAIQTYVGNAGGSSTIPSPAFATVSTNCTTSPSAFGLTVVSTPGSVCASPLTYSWTGPGSFTSSNPSFSINSPTAANSGTYTVVVKDANGCIITKAAGYNAIACSLIPLPLQLSSFTGTIENCTTSLSWKNTDEGNLMYYELQNSIDGSKFEPLNRIYGKGGLTNEYNYEYKAENGRRFYRLSLVGMNGKSIYSNVISVFTNCGNENISIYPNPTQDIVNLAGLNSGEIIEIYNFMGQLVKSQLVNNTVEQVNLGSISSGNYQIIVLNGKLRIKVGIVTRK